VWARIEHWGVANYTFILTRNKFGLSWYKPYVSS